MCSQCLGGMSLRENPVPFNRSCNDDILGCRFLHGGVALGETLGVISEASSPSGILSVHMDAPDFCGFVKRNSTMAQLNDDHLASRISHHL